MQVWRPLVLHGFYCFHRHHFPFIIALILIYILHKSKRELFYITTMIIVYFWMDVKLFLTPASTNCQAFLSYFNYTVPTPEGSEQHGLDNQSSERDRLYRIPSDGGT